MAVLGRCCSNTSKLNDMPLLLQAHMTDMNDAHNLKSGGYGLICDTSHCDTYHMLRVVDLI